MALPKTLAKSEKRRIKAECRVAFSLDTFFWPSKRKCLGCRAETRLENTRRDSDTLKSKKSKTPHPNPLPEGAGEKPFNQPPLPN